MRVRGETTAIVPCESSLMPRHLHLAPTATDLGNDLAQVCAPGDAQLKVHRAGTKLPRPRRGAATEMHVATGKKLGKKEVWTMSTLLASDRVVYRSDWAGFGMFSGVPSVCRGWNAVRVPPRAQQIPSSEGIFALTCVQSLWWRPSDASARALAWPPRWPIQVCGWRVQRPGWWAFRLLFLCSCYAFLSWLWRPGWPAYLFMVRICLDDMTWANFF